MKTIFKKLQVGYDALQLEGRPMSQHRSELELRSLVIKDSGLVYEAKAKAKTFSKGQGQDRRCQGQDQGQDNPRPRPRPS